MMFQELDTVVLAKYVPEYGLRSGDLGAVVGVYEPDGLDVELVTALGRTKAVVTLTDHDVRPAVCLLADFGVSSGSHDRSCARIALIVRVCPTLVASDCMRVTCTGKDRFDQKHKRYKGCLFKCGPRSIALSIA